MDVNEVAVEAVIFFVVVGIPVFLLLGLSVPPAIKRRSWLFFLRALMLLFAGIVFPLFIYFWSSFLVPDSKAKCHFGRLDCFYTGKICLVPLVLWACAAFYYVVVLKKRGADSRWMVLGIFSGAVASWIMLTVGSLSSTGSLFGCLWWWFNCSF